MNSPIFLYVLLIWQLFDGSLTTTTTDIYQDNVKKCPFVQTVNITNQQKFENGSRLYQGIIIPPEKQALYDAVYFMGKKKLVPLHLRGCVCENQVCFNFCCNLDEYYNETRKKCEKLKSLENVIWNINVVDRKRQIVVNIFEYFKTQQLFECLEPDVLQQIPNNWTFFKQGILSTENKHMFHGEFCFSFHLMLNEFYILKPYTCRMDDSYRKIILNQYSLNTSLIFLIPTVIMNILLKQLRSSLPDKLCFYYISSMTMGNLIFSILNIIFKMRGNTVVFVILGFLGYSCDLVAILWLSVLCYDIWLNERNRKQFIYYSLYVGFTACLAIVFYITIKVSWVWTNIDNHTIDEICLWNANKWSALQFYGSTLLILMFTCLRFAYSAFVIYKLRDNVDKFKMDLILFKQNGIFISRLFLILGVPWSFHILSNYVKDDEDVSFLFLLLHFGDGIQGILIFALFVWRNKIWIYFKQKTCKVRTPQEDCIHTWMTDTLGQN